MLSSGALKNCSRFLWENQFRMSVCGWCWSHYQPSVQVITLEGFWSVAACLCCRRSLSGEKATLWGRVCLTKQPSPPSASKAPPIQRSRCPRIAGRTTARGQQPLRPLCQWVSSVGAFRVRTWRSYVCLQCHETLQCFSHRVFVWVNEQVWGFRRTQQRGFDLKTNSQNWVRPLVRSKSKVWLNIL